MILHDVSSMSGRWATRQQAYYLPKRYG